MQPLMLSGKSFIFAVALAAVVAGAHRLGSGSGTTACAAAATPAAVTASPLPSIYPASSTYTLKANGREVPVVDFSRQYDYAVFTLDGGPCKLEVARRDGKPIARHSVSPQKLALQTNVTRSGALAFTVARPQYLIVAIDDLRKLVIAIDPPETDKPAASGPGVYNVTAAPYGADPTGAAPATAALQRAVDDAGKDPSQAGVVYVPAGVFHLSELRLVSNVSLYLESGAVLRLSGTREDFKLRYKKNSQNRHGTWFIYTADGATNVKILGRGTIDGDGKRIEKDLDLTSHLVIPMNCTGFTMDGPVLRDSGLWGTVVANSRQVALRNTKHFNHLDMGENDCVDICNSQDVVVERSIGISLDDPYSTKTWEPGVDIARQWTGESLPNRNIVMDNCLSWTRCFAFKVGAGVWRDQENITIRNCVAYDSAHAFGISHSYGSRDVRGVLVENLDVERNTMTNLGRSWARFVIDKRKPDGGAGGSIYDVVIRNVHVRDAGTDPVPVTGLSPDKRIVGLTFEQIRMPGKKAPAATLEQVGVTEQTFADRVAIGAASRGSGAAPGQVAAPAADREQAVGRRDRPGETPKPRTEASPLLSR